MILGPISFSDCFAFILSLVPQLLYRVKWVELLQCFVNIFPFLGEDLPVYLKFYLD